MLVCLFVLYSDSAVVEDGQMDGYSAALTHVSSCSAAMYKSVTSDHCEACNHIEHITITLHPHVLTEPSLLY